VNLDGLTEKRNRVGTVYYENELGEIVAKRCGECKYVKPLYEYKKSKTGLGGRGSHCKYCRDNQYKSNKEYESERSRKYYGANKEIVNERTRKYYEANKEQHAELTRKWRTENKERQVETNHEYYEANKIAVNERTRNWREANKEYHAELLRNWARNNPDKIAMYSQRRRARKAELPNTLTTEEYEKTLTYFDNTCALTGRTDNIEMEHAIPISIGHGGTTFGNCYPMVSGLNQSKHFHNIFEWFDANQQRFNLEQERFDRLIEWLGNANGMTVEEYRDYVYECHADPNEIIDAEAN
jgi:hypothetical protein